jgi:hypothetical protein
MLGAALVETELLTPHSNVWCSVVGVVLFSGGAGVGWHFPDRG